MPFTLLRQERTLVLGHAAEFSSVKVSFHPIRHPDGNPIVFFTETPELALALARRTFPSLGEILLAVEPFSEEKHGRASSRVH